MKGSLLTVELPLEAVPVNRMPANCEILARAYVGDLQFGLARDPKSRALYLLSLDGYWRLDMQQLVAAFADALRDLQRELEYIDGASIAGSKRIVVARPLQPRQSAWAVGTRARARTPARKSRRRNA